MWECLRERSHIFSIVAAMRRAQGQKGKQMGEFFNIDNKFFQGLSKVVDCVVLSILWVVSCIPVFTVGAATTALYYAVNKVIRHSRGYIWQEFWDAFRSNFKQATLVWLICLAAMAFMGMDCYIMLQYARAGERIGSLYIVFVIFLVLLVMWQSYLFPYIARFAIGTKAVFQNAALIAVANLPWSLLLLVLIAAACLVAWILPPIALFLPGAYMVAANYILERVFRKYMTEEDLAAEEERNQEFYH